MSLESYLKQSKNSVIREKLINYKFLYELKLHAAIRESNFDIYIPEIDKEGIDLIIDNGDYIRKFQIKTVLKKSTTKSWYIQSQLLKPSLYNSGFMNIEPASSGVEGGFILIEINIESDNISFNYYFTDFFIIKALELGIIKNKYFKNIKDYSKFIKNLILLKRNNKIKITKGYLVQLSNIDSVMNILNMISYSSWQSNIIKYLTEQNITKQTGLKEMISEKLIDFLNDDRILFN